MKPEAPIEKIEPRVFRIPTETPEADGTLDWNATTMLLVTAAAGGATGMGYSYSGASAAAVVSGKLAEAVRGVDAMDTPRAWIMMVRSVRNLGWPGIAACAISAVDAALWDLKAKLLNVSLVALLGAERSSVPIYGSGGFTDYDDARLREQLCRWVGPDGCRAVKMKVGREPSRDMERVRQARSAIGEAELYVDANGALTRKQALAYAEVWRQFGVTWFEEPVSSDDLEGLRLLRDRAPAVIDIVAGEYGYQPFYFRRMLEAGSVDIIQADATRCGGITGFMRAAALADAFMLPLSTHTAPALHLHAACAAPRIKNMEWFYDHVRIEGMLFDGAPVPHDGAIGPDLSRPGLGLSCKEADARPFAV
ncbi:MAG: enolase C-terminal domain-like protein [Rhodomicrobiaceae bacterium]